jgi:pimeloyl-ACP methyl ester carboxylesterase
MKKMLLTFLVVGAGLYLLLCAALYFKQEALLFYPEKLPATHQFGFAGRYAEHPITASDGTTLSGILFKADTAKGLVFFLHGNGGSLAGWGTLASVYTRRGYDVFMLDYRGYGKSGGTISSQAELLSDVETAFQQVAAGYLASKSNVVIVGYSLGTGPATWLAGRHKPDMLLLHAPYYSMTDMAGHTVPIWPILPNWLLRYPLPTDKWIRQVAAPIVLFHGDRDGVIPHNSSVRLQALLKPNEQFITIKGSGHNDLLDHPQYQQVIATLLK